MRFTCLVVTLRLDADFIVRRIRRGVRVLTPAFEPSPITAHVYVVAIAAALPWILAPLITVWRARDSVALSAFRPELADDPPLVSVVIPARDEAPRIARCVRSVLASTYPRLDVIIVDDYSADGTGELARAIVAEDPRLRVIVPPPLPAGWFGKQWACATGADEARGQILLFTDADTAHAPDLLPRAVNALESLKVDGLTVVGRQELGSFWERVVQPQIFSMFLVRYGGTERVNRSPRAGDKIANGQWLMLRRSAYDSVGGHAAVRDRAAEDLALAQEVHRAGLRLPVLLALELLSTRMYTSLSEIVGGWSKNVWVAGLETTRGGTVGRAMYAPLLILLGLSLTAPPLVLLATLASASWGPLALWAAIATSASLLWWGTVYRFAGVGARYAPAYPLGGAVLFYIFLRAIARGSRVEWKGREYRARARPT